MASPLSIDYPAQSSEMHHCRMIMVVGTLHDLNHGEYVVVWDSVDSPYAEELPTGPVVYEDYGPVKEQVRERMMTFRVQNQIFLVGSPEARGGF